MCAPASNSPSLLLTLLASLTALPICCLVSTWRNSAVSPQLLKHNQAEQPCHSSRCSKALTYRYRLSLQICCAENLRWIYPSACLRLSPSCLNPLHAGLLFSNRPDVQRTDSLGEVCAHRSERNLFSFHSTLTDFIILGLLERSICHFHLLTKLLHHPSERHNNSISRSCSPSCQIQPSLTVQTALRS